MFVSTHVLTDLSTRIERAYFRRLGRWSRFKTNARVWESAASLLLRAHLADPAIPLDPELFVASQTSDSLIDPWRGLAQAKAIQRYRARVARIINQLKAELEHEIRLVDRKRAQGERLEDLLLRRSRKLSPLGRFVIAIRAEARDLAESFRLAAQLQHRACPLYREACVGLIKAADYPVLRVAGGVEIWTAGNESRLQARLEAQRN